MNKICRSNLDQLVEALTCPVNRFSTMREHSCDEWELFNNPGWLIAHYIEFGGAEAHALLRKVRQASLPNGQTEGAVTPPTTTTPQ